MAGRVKTWVWVVLGLIVTCVVAVVAIAGAGFYFFTRHIQTRTVSPATASREFDEIKARFSGQKPLVELDRHGAFVRSNPDRPTRINGRVPEQLFVMAFDPDDGRVVRLTIPVLAAPPEDRRRQHRLQRQADEPRGPEAERRRPRALRTHAHRRSRERGREPCPRLVAVTVP